MTSETKTYAAMGLLALSLACLTAVDAWASQTGPQSLIGDWRAADGLSAARIAPCGGATGLCATVTEHHPAAGETSLVGQVVVRNLTPARNGWSGRYVADGQDLSARVRQINPRTIELRACVAAFLCDSARYVRADR